jgi:hypothetical protein
MNIKSTILRWPGSVRDPLAANGIAANFPPLVDLLTALQVPERRLDITELRIGLHHLFVSDSLRCKWKPEG